MSTFLDNLRGEYRISYLKDFVRSYDIPTKHPLSYYNKNNAKLLNGEIMDWISYETHTSIEPTIAEVLPTAVPYALPAVVSDVYHDVIRSKSRSRSRRGRRKLSCQRSPYCKWKMGQGYRRPKPVKCSRRRKQSCERSPHCEWVRGEGCFKI